MKYVYCLAKDIEAGHNSSAAAVFPPGLSGAEVHYVSFMRISALMSDVDSGQLVDNVQNALAHQEVVDAGLKFSKSIIPCRFGTLFPDDKKILMLLKEQHARLDALLTKLEGKIEVSIQAAFNLAATVAPEASKVEESEDPLPKGVNYLLKKKEQFDIIKQLKEEADRFTQELNQVTSPLWSNVKVQKRSTSEALLLSLCYLVGHQELPAFKRAYQGFKSGKPNLKLLYTGPWLPYSFADIDLSTGKE